MSLIPVPRAEPEAKIAKRAFARFRAPVASPGHSF